jgi:hypothetical protein
MSRHLGTIERHHRFAKHLAFGGEGLLKSNDPADQEKAVVYSELVANAVALQNVVDQQIPLQFHSYASSLGVGPRPMRNY